MKYLFFDTESSNCFNNMYKMCEWGSLLTDEAFNVFPRTKMDVLINPGRDGKFNLTGRKGGRDLVLAHSEAEYKAARLFKDHYDNIKFFLSQKDALIFLWASENDIQALLDQCVRYGLPMISFVSYDVQMLFKKAFPETPGMSGLESAMKLLNLDTDGIKAHRPDDDSLMTSMVLKRLCEKSGKTVRELIEDCPKCKMESISTYKDMKARHEANLERKRLEEGRKKVLKPYLDELNVIFNHGYPKDTPNERIFCTSRCFREHIDETLEKIKQWINRGFFLGKTSDAKYFVCYDSADKERLAANPDFANMEFVSADEFDALTDN